MVRKIIYVSICQGIEYIVLFLLLPRITAFSTQPLDVYFYVYSTDTFRNSFIFALASIICCLPVVILAVDRIKLWSVGIPILWGLIILYHPERAYGLGYYDGFGLMFSMPVPLRSLGIAVYVFTVQSALCLSKRGMQKLIGKKHLKALR